MLADLVKIHCLTHRANFPMSRSSKIVICKEGREEHVLCNDFPHSGLWMYCCCCQTFIAWQKGRTDISIKQCPVCFASLNPRIYVCDHCSVTMMDFDNAGTRKLHNVTPIGSPQPACPGCLNSPKSRTQKHQCEVMGAEVTTAVSVCPFCSEQLFESADMNATNDLPRRESITVVATDDILDAEFTEQENTATQHATASSTSAGDTPLTDTNSLNNNWGSVTRVTNIPGNDQYYNYEPFVEKRLQDYPQPEIISNRSVLQDSARISQAPQVEFQSRDLSSHIDVSYITDGNTPRETDKNGNVIDYDLDFEYDEHGAPPPPQSDKFNIVVYSTAAVILFITLMVLIIIMVRLYLN